VRFRAIQRAIEGFNKPDISEADRRKIFAGNAGKLLKKKLG
jgi:hypothetical protein